MSIQKFTMSSSEASKNVSSLTGDIAMLSIADEESQESKPLCSICQEEPVNPVELPCSHVFCYICVKGIAARSGSCALCRKNIPSGYLDSPNVVGDGLCSKLKDSSSKVYHWFYECKSGGWWMYEDRTSEEIEKGFLANAKSVKVQISGFMYVVNYETMVQLREDRPNRTRRIKRDLITSDGIKDRAECEMKKAGLRQAGRGAVVGLTAGASASKSKKVRGSSMAKAKKTQSQVKNRALADLEKKLSIPAWTKEDEMARKMQTCYRGYRCRKLLKELQKKKTDYDQMMEKLQRDAYLQMVKLEQQCAEAERMRVEEEKRKKKERAQRIARMLEAAFDGDTMEIQTVLEEVQQLYKDQSVEVALRNRYMLVECSDANCNSPLSEAAAGGDVATIRLLLSLEANPNRKGQYGRTPLYRAAFAGHHEAVKVLLERGADPRITTDDGEKPDQVASNQKVESVFLEWNIENTEQLLRKLDDAQEKRKAAHDKILETIDNTLKKAVDEAEKEYSVKQKQLLKAHEELNKRIFEHDKNIATEAVKTDITLAVVHDAEGHLEAMRLAAESARKKLSDTKLQWRLKRKEFENDDESSETNDEISDATINIRELDDVLMKDVGNKIAESGKWPLLIDSGKQAATFLRYRDTNYVNCCNPRQMDPQALRMALLGAIKYGKFFVLDLMDIDGLWAGVEQRMNDIQTNLLKDLMDMSLIKQNKFQSLVRDSDGDEYSAKMLLSARVHEFKLVVLTQLLSPPKQFTEQFYVISIHVSNPSLSC